MLSLEDWGDLALFLTHAQTHWHMLPDSYVFFLSRPKYLHRVNNLKLSRMVFLFIF